MNFSLRFLCLFLLAIAFMQAKLKIAVSIEPQKYFIQQIAGDLADVYVMVPNAKNPEQYEPLLSQMKDLRNCTLYFGVGLEFEHKWQQRFLDSAKNMQFVSLFDENHSHNSPHYHHHDNHIWLSVKLAKKQANTIYEHLSKLDPINQKIYQRNLETFLHSINELDHQIKEIFKKPNAKKTFLVFHPAFEYLAHEYGLEELSIEVMNKEVKIKHMQSIYQAIKEKKLKVIYAEPQFSQKQVQLIAKEYNLKISFLDPFAYDWKNNLLEIAKKIAYEY